MHFWTSQEKGTGHMTNHTIAQGAESTRERASRKARKLYGKGRYTLHKIDSLESPSPELLTALGRLIIDRNT